MENKNILLKIAKIKKVIKGLKAVKRLKWLEKLKRQENVQLEALYFTIIIYIKSIKKLKIAQIIGYKS